MDFKDDDLNLENIDLEDIEDLDDLENMQLLFEETEEQKQKSLDKIKSLLHKVNADEDNKKREQQELINQHVDYNDKTLKIFDDFVKDFMFLYPGVLTEEELYNRLKANIKHDIVFGKIESDTENKISGMFDSKNHMVIINTEVAKTEDKIKATLFHELCHSLVENNPYDNEVHEYYEENNFVTEGIITLMEEDYYEKILNRKFNRVNGYIPNYARGLRNIFGNELIKQYIRNFKYIDSLIASAEVGNNYHLSKIAYDLVNSIDNVYYYIRESFGEVDVAYENANIELGVAALLDDYLTTNNDLKDEEKMKKIEGLLNTELEPNFKLFKEIIDKHIANKELLHNSRALEFVYNADVNDYKDVYSRLVDFDNPFNNIDLASIKHKYEKYAVKEFFGVNEYSYSNSMFINLPFYDREKVNNYNEYSYLYEALHALRYNGELTDADLDIVSISTDFKKDKREIDTEKIISHGYDNISSSLFNLFYTQKAFSYKINTTSGEYYVIKDYDAELLRKISINDYIIQLHESVNDRKTTVEEFKALVEHLNSLRNEGIDEIYASSVSYIYDKDGKTYRAYCKYDQDEQNDKDIVSVNVKEINLKEIDYLKPDKLQVQKINKV